MQMLDSVLTWSDGQPTFTEKCCVKATLYQFIFTFFFTRRQARDSVLDIVPLVRDLAEQGAVGVPVVPGERHARLCLLAKCLACNCCVCTLDILSRICDQSAVIFCLKIHTAIGSDQSPDHQPICAPCPPIAAIIRTPPVLLQPSNPSILPHMSARSQPPVAVQPVPGDAQCVYIIVPPSIDTTPISPLLSHQVQPVSSDRVDHGHPRLAGPVGVCSKSSSQSFCSWFP